VCDGFSDCPSDEDEKKCTALIDDELQERIISESSSTEHLPTNDNHSESEKIAKESHLDQEAIESSIIDTTTLYVLPNDPQFEKLTTDKNLLPQIEKLVQRKDADKSEITVAVSSREISSSAPRNALTENNPYASESKSNRTFPTNVASRKEIEYSYRRLSYNYNDKGYLSVRKNGKWGKLCLNDTNDPSQERQRQNMWSIEDLAKAACKAVTYQ